MSSLTRVPFTRAMLRQKMNGPIPHLTIATSMIWTFLIDRLTTSAYALSEENSARLLFVLFALYNVGAVFVLTQHAAAKTSSLWDVPPEGIAVGEVIRELRNH